MCPAMFLLTILLKFAQIWHEDNSMMYFIISGWREERQKERIAKNSAKKRTAPRGREKRRWNAGRRERKRERETTKERGKEKGKERGLERNKHTWRFARARRRFIISSVAKRSLVNRPGDQSETLYHGRPDHRPTNGCTLCHVHATSRVGPAPPLASPPGVACVFPPRAREPFYATFSFVSPVSRRRCVDYVCAYVCTLDVRMCTRLPSCARSSVRSSGWRRCAREPRRRSALLFYSRILFFIRADARFAFVSLLFRLSVAISFSFEKQRERE